MLVTDINKLKEFDQECARVFAIGGMHVQLKDPSHRPIKKSDIEQLDTKGADNFLSKYFSNGEEYDLLKYLGDD